MNFSWHAWKKDRVDVFIGPECSPALSVTALLASNLNLPVFGPFSMMASLGNKEKYPTLTRVSQYLNQVEAVATLIAYYNWTRVAIIRNMGSICDSCLAAINEALDYRDINLAATLVANFSNPDDVGYTLRELKTWARIIIVCGGYTPNTALPMLLKAYDMNMTYPDYVFIIPDFITPSFNPWQPWLDSSIFNTSTAAKYILIYRSVVVTDSYVISTQVSSQKTSFIDEYVAQHKQEFPKYNPVI
uniref:Receptor ligand binding region domain-containing protein n=1 Tax=Romanomermis culicivorax TaxID=13658 RepID=A0A915KBJ3_ROMCU